MLLALWCCWCGVLQGGTCGFGNRGQKARSGPSVRPGFEGGQTPLYRRLPKLRGIAGGEAALRSFAGEEACRKFCRTALRELGQHCSAEVLLEASRKEALQQQGTAAAAMGGSKQWQHRRQRNMGSRLRTCGEAAAEAVAALLVADTSAAPLAGQQRALVVLPHTCGCTAGSSSGQSLQQVASARSRKD